MCDRAWIPHYKPTCVSNYSPKLGTPPAPFNLRVSLQCSIATLLFRIPSPRSSFFLFLLSVLTSSYTHFFIHSIKSLLLCLSLLPPFCTAHYIPPSVDLIMPFHFISLLLIILFALLLVPPFMHGTAFSLLLTAYPFYPPPFKASIYKSHYIPQCFIFTPNHLCIHYTTAQAHFCTMHFYLSSHYGSIRHAHVITCLPFRCSHCIASFMSASHYSLYSRFDNKLTKTDR